MAFGRRTLLLRRNTRRGVKGGGGAQPEDEMKTTLKFALIAVASLVATGAPAASKPAPATYTGHEWAGGAKLSLTQARAIALKVRKGQIVDQELEKEAGGSGLRYAFDVKSKGVTYEVGVDAVTGKVLENGAESAAKEAREAKTEKAEKMAAKH
jgi:uncharacterized membrane protein YkoI